MSPPGFCAPELSDDASQCMGCGLSKVAEGRRGGEGGREHACLSFLPTGPVVSGSILPALGRKEL